MAGVGGGRMWNGYALSTIFFSRHYQKCKKQTKSHFPVFPTPKESDGII